MRHVHVAGNLNLDILLGPLGAWPGPGTETVLPEHAVRAGGAAANAALALHALGVSVELHGGLGDDAFGDVVRNELGVLGSGADGVRRLTGPTGFSVGITHPGHERTFLTYLGHLERDDAAALARSLERSRDDAVLLCGYFLMPAFRSGALGAVLRAAHERRHTVLLDTGWPSEGWTPDVRAELADLLPRVDVLLPNAEELAGWTGEDRPEAGIARLEALGPRVVVKLGAAGAGWREAGRFRRVAAPPLPVVDTVGAGDVFNAGFIAARHGGLPLAQAVAAGVRAAGLTISSRPRRYPSWSEVRPDGDDPEAEPARA